MADLNLQLFGAFSASDHSGQEIPFRDNKVRALLAYLTVEQGQAHPRKKLVELFWGYAPQERAQHSLRMALNRLQRSLDQAGGRDFLKVTRQTVHFQPASDRFWADVIQFERLAAETRAYPGVNLAIDYAMGERLARVVELYRGGFLTGISLRDSPSFDDWLMHNHNRYEQQVLHFLDLLTEQALENYQHEQAERYALRRLEILPWLESSHRQLMRVYAMRGEWQLVQQQYQKCVQVLETELGTDPEPETTTLLEQLRHTPPRPRQPEQRPAAPVKTITAAPHNLPHTYTPFLGRENERGRLIHALLDDAISALTIVGPGGAGKTRLILDGVRHILHHPAFKDGVWFIPLEGLRAGDKNLYEAIANNIAKAVRLELRTPHEPHEQLFDWLGDRKMLLALDNFEQLIVDDKAEGESDGVDFVLDLLARAPQVKLLISSRRTLNLQMEAVITLDGLPTPTEPDQSAYQYSSVLLFMERGRRANQQFTLDSDSLLHVVEICRILGGMPLGLELAAVRLREMSCQQIAQTLKTNLDLLAARLRDLPPRHQSMRAVFDWSWSLLEAEEQRVLAELAVFRGSFTLEAAKAVTGAENEHVYALIDHSLVRFSEDRYSLHLLLRQFAYEKLAQPAPIQARHSRYYLAFVRERGVRLIGKDLVQATKEISLAWENVQAAWNWAVSQGELVDLAPTISSLGRYLSNSSMLWFGEKLFQEAVQRLEENDASEAPAARLARRQAVGHLWLELAHGYIWSAQHEACITAAQQAVQFGLALDCDDLAAGGYLEWGRALWRLGEYPRAVELLNQSLSLTASNSWHALQALNTLGNIYSAWGKFDLSVAYYEQALQVQKDAGIWSNRVQALNNLATIAAMRGQHQQATRLWFEVLEISRQFDQAYYQITIFHNLGLVHSELGLYAKSEAFFLQALALSDDLKSHQNITEIWLGLAQLHRRMGRYAESEAGLERVFKLGEQFGEKKATGEALMQLALFHYAQGDLPAAGKAAQQSVAMIQELGFTEIGADVLITSGYCLSALGAFEDARLVFITALDTIQDTGNPHKAIEAQVGLAHVLLQQGERQAAEPLVEQAWRGFAEQENLMGAVLPYDLYRLLSACLEKFDPTRAGQAQRSAQALIQAHAQAIPDLDQRRAFLQQPICELICRQTG